MSKIVPVQLYHPEETELVQAWTLDRSEFSVWVYFPHRDELWSFTSGGRNDEGDYDMLSELIPSPQAKALMKSLVDQYLTEQIKTIKTTEGDPL